MYDAAVEAIGHTDKAVGTIYQACQDAGYILLITADHGNAEQMINPETGAPHTAHTTNPVPFIMTGDPKKFAFVEDVVDGEEEPGALCDVAPTVLDLMVSLSLTMAVMTCAYYVLRRVFPSLRVSISSCSPDSWRLTCLCRNVWTLLAGQERVDIEIEPNTNVIYRRREMAV